MAAPVSNQSNSSPENQSAERAIWKSVSVVAVVTLGSRVCGLVRDLVTAAFFGAGSSADAFLLAFRIPNMLRRLVADGALTAAFVPVFSTAQREGDQKAKKTYCEVFNFCLLASVVITILGIYFAKNIVLIFAPGFASSEKFDLAVALLRIMFPYVTLVSLLALCSGTLNSVGFFALPAAAPIFFNISLILSILTLFSRFQEPTYALAYGVVIGGLFALIPQQVMLWRKGFRLSFASLCSPHLLFKSRAIRDLLRLMVPSLIAASIFQLMVLVNSVLASMLADGTISWLYYADRLFQFPLGVFTVAVSTTLLPRLSKLAIESRHGEFSELLRNALSWVSFITIPASIALIYLSVPIVKICFEYRAFGAEDTAATAASLVGYAVGLWALSCHSVLVRAFFARKNSTLPALVTLISVIFNVLVAIALMGPTISEDRNILTKLVSETQQLVGIAQLAHFGIALAGSVAAFVSLIVLTLFLPSAGINLDKKLILKSVAISLTGSIAMLAILFALSLCIHSVYLLVPSSVLLGIISYLAATFALGSEEAGRLVQILSGARCTNSD